MKFKVNFEKWVRKLYKINNGTLNFTVIKMFDINFDGVDEPQLLMEM